MEPVDVYMAGKFRSVDYNHYSEYFTLFVMVFSIETRRNPTQGTIDPLTVDKAYGRYLDQKHAITTD